MQSATSKRVSRVSSRRVSSRNVLQRAEGTLMELKGCDEIDVEPGDVFVIETPGGGGFGVG